MRRTAGDLVEHVHHLTALLQDRSEVCLPGEFADSLHSGVVLFFNGDQLRVRGNDALLDDPLAHLADAVKFLLPLEPLRRFVSFMGLPTWNVPAAGSDR